MTLPKESELSQSEPTLDESAIAAMRVYLQRAEVRLSTMHRIAGVFLNGAGLLVLFPALFRDSVTKLLLPVIEDIRSGAVAHIMGWVAFLVLLGLPIYALILLLRDLAFFYFTAHRPWHSVNNLPRFGLFGLSLPTNPASAGDLRLVAEVRRRQLDPNLSDFLLPGRENVKDRRYLQRIVRWDSNIIPPTRRDWLKTIPDGPQREDAKDLSVAFGLAGAETRSILDEVARMELSLVRHSLYLRRLVLRYLKALLMLIVAAVVVQVVAASYLAPGNNRSASDTLTANLHTTVGVACLVWALATVLVVGRPINWIYGLAGPGLVPSDAARDPELVHFEVVVIWSCFFAWVASSIALFVNAFWATLILGTIFVFYAKKAAWPHIKSES